MKKQRSIFARRLVKARQAKDMRQIDLAKALGVSVGAVDLWENDRCNPRMELLPDIADVLDLSIDWLLGRSEVKNYER